MKEEEDVADKGDSIISNLLMSRPFCTTCTLAEFVHCVVLSHAVLCRPETSSVPAYHCACDRVGGHNRGTRPSYTRRKPWQ